MKILRPCPYWSNWKEFGECTASCGGGKRRRSRGCMYGPGCPGGIPKKITNKHIILRSKLMVVRKTIH